MRVLVVNAGSSTLKLSLLGERDETVDERELSAPRAVVDERELREALDAGLGAADAVGHRIVHGGALFRDPVRLDVGVERALHGLTDLAPLHQPKSLAALQMVSRALPGLPAVACFDTAFHSTLPARARTYAVPARWREQWDIRRYGFHGLSHAWVARRAPQILDREPPALRIVSAHLGAGASLCAIAGGHSVDTTMGFTPLEGLVMATRSGSVDPGLVLWLLERTGTSERELAHALEHESGLRGLAGTADMREVLARAEQGEASAELALEVYIHRLRSSVAGMAASLGGMDALVFTGGIGQRSAEVRRRAAAGLGFLGLGVDERLNRSATGDADISAPEAPGRTLVIEAREDREIARQVREVLG